jgi:hypothetical protein
MGLSDIDLDHLFPLNFNDPDLDLSNIPTVDFDALVSFKGFGSGSAISNDAFGVPSGASLANNGAAASTNVFGTSHPFPSSADGVPNDLASMSSGAGVLSSTGSAANDSNAPAVIRFRAPATPNTLPGQKRKNSGGDSDAAPAAKKPRKSAGSSESATGSASEKPKRKTRSDKGKPRERAAAARAALENETPEQRDARLAEKKASALRKIQARVA